MTYATIYIRHEINSFLKDEYANVCHPSYLETDACYEDDIAGSISFSKDINRVRALLPLLSKQEKYIIEKMFLTDNPKTISEIANSKGISRQRVHQLKESAIDKLKRGMKP